MPLLTPEEYADLGASVQAGIVALIASVVDVGVLDRDPVNYDESRWAGALKDAGDTDDEGKKRIHKWIVTFAGSTDLESDTVRSIEPTFRFRVQVFAQHEFGKDTDNSEKRIRAEILKVQMKIAQTLEIVAGTRHGNLPMRVGLASLFKEVVHRGEAELAVRVLPIITR